MKHYSQEELSGVIGKIYDCAVDPELWAPTLTGIRDQMDLAYVQVTYIDRNYGGDDHSVILQTDWPKKWMEEGPRWVPHIPGIDRWLALDIDQSISQMQCIEEDEFQQCDFYRHYVEPQGLRDFCHTAVAKRPSLLASLGAGRFAKDALFDDAGRDALRILSPHIRRSLLISGMLDEGRLKLRLYQRLLDQISTGIMIVNGESSLVYANTQADRILTEGTSITVRHNRLQVLSAPHARGFHEALARACSGIDSDLGTCGNGIALPGSDGTFTVCYVLPLGNSEPRRALGAGMAAIFLSNGETGMPPAVEVLSALTGLTSREARIALMIADGRAPGEVAAALGISLNTVRTHIANVFEKAGVNSQRALVHFVSSLSMPLSLSTPAARV